MSTIGDSDQDLLFYNTEPTFWYKFGKKHSSISEKLVQIGDRALKLAGKLYELGDKTIPEKIGKEHPIATEAAKGAYCSFLVSMGSNIGFLTLLGIDTLLHGFDYEKAKNVGIVVGVSTPTLVLGGTLIGIMAGVDENR
jgi:hypothetical protein